MSPKIRHHTTSPKMLAALRELRGGRRDFVTRTAEYFDAYSVSAKDVRRLEREHGRLLRDIPELSRGARYRWRRFGAQGLYALEAVYWITGGKDDGGVWVV